jgi:hypothetical protein
MDVMCVAVAYLDAIPYLVAFMTLLTLFGDS